MLKKLVALLTGKPSVPKFHTTYELAKYAMDQIDREMKTLFSEKGKVSLTEAEAIGKRAEAINERVKVTVTLTPNSVFMARHAVSITGTNQEWFVDNFIDKYKNPNIK